MNIYGIAYFFFADIALCTKESLSSIHYIRTT
jgi:hypothetical protein